MRRLALVLVIWFVMAVPCAASTIIVGTSTHAGGSGNANNAIPVPAGVINGDTLLMCFKLDSTTVTTLGGTFTSCTNFASLVDATNGTLDMKCGCRTASSEPASYTPTWTGNSTSLGMIFVVRNSDGTTPAIDVTTTTTNNGASPASITTATNNDLILDAILDNTGNAGTITAGANPMNMSVNIQNAHLLYGSQKTAGATTWQPTSMTFAGAGTVLEATIAVKANTTTAVMPVGRGIDSYNSGSASSVSPTIPENGNVGDVLLASVTSRTTGLAVTEPVYNGTYAGSGITYGSTTLVNTDAHTAITDVATGNGVKNSITPPILSVLTGTTEECWVKVTSASMAGPFMLLGSGSATDGYGIGAGTSWSGANMTLSGYVAGTGFASFAGAPTLVQNTIYHVVAENDSSAFNIWINGTQYVGSLHGGVAPTAQVLGISLNSGTVVQQKVAFYNYKLNATQIANHYLAGTTAPSGYGGAGVTGGATYDAVIKNDGPVIYWNEGESVGTTATNIGTMAIPWTLVGSAVVDEAATISESLYSGIAIGGHGAAQFNFGSAASASDGLIADFSNVNTTTPVDTNHTLSNEGLANAVTAPLPSPSAMDELAVVANGYANCTPTASQVTGSFYPQTLIGGGTASMYVMTPDYAMATQLVDQCGNAYASIALGLNANTTPTRTTAALRLQQQIEEIFSLAPAPSPPANNGSWFF